jgi:hypothetical protein
VYVSSGADGFGVFLAARSAAKNTLIFLPTLERQGQIGPQSDMHPPCTADGFPDLLYNRMDDENLENPIHCF